MARFPSFYGWVIYTYGCCSVAQSCLTLCDPMDCSQASLSSPSPRVCPSSCSLHWWCHPAISSSDDLFSFYPWSFPASGTFPMSHLFESGDQNTGTSVSASVLPVNIQGWSHLRLTGPRDFQKSSPAPQLEGINSLALCLLYCPALTTIHDHYVHIYIYMYILYIACHILERETEGEESSRHLLMWGVRFHPEGEGREDRTPQTPCHLPNSPTGWISLLSPECPRSNTLVDIFHLTNCVGYSEAQIHKNFLKEDFYKSYWEVEYF